MDYGHGSTEAIFLPTLGVMVLGESEISKDWKKKVLEALELEFAPP